VNEVRSVGVAARNNRLTTSRDLIGVASEHSLRRCGDDLFLLLYARKDGARPSNRLILIAKSMMLFFVRKEYKSDCSLSDGLLRNGHYGSDKPHMKRVFITDTLKDYRECYLYFNSFNSTRLRYCNAFKIICSHF